MRGARGVAADTPVWRGNPALRGAGRAEPVAEKVRRRRLRVALKVLALAVAGAVAFEAGQLTRAFIARDPAFRLQRIAVAGPLRHDPAILEGALSDLMGRSLLEVEAGDIGARLAPFPWVRGFLFRKRYPHTLTVEVAERPQLCAVGVGGKVYEVDGLGHVWPALPGVPGVFEATGVDVSDPDFQALVAALLKEGLAGKVDGLSGGGGGTFLLATPDGFTLRVAPGDHLGAQWERFLRARPWVEENAPGRMSLDLRWEGKVVLEAPAPGAPEGGGAPGGPPEGGLP